MRFFEWRKGIIARLTHPYRYENVRANRSVFLPKGTTFITEHARRGMPGQFQVPVDVLDRDVPQTNMSTSVEKLYPNANFLFVGTDENPIRAEITSLDRVETEWFAVSHLDEVEGSIPYLSEGKAINYLGKLAVADNDAILMKRTRDSLEEIHASQRWFDNVRRMDQVVVGDHSIRGMKSRVNQNLHPQHDYRWFTTVTMDKPAGTGSKAMARAFNDFRRVVSEGTIAGHYLTEGFRTSPDATDLISLHGMIHNEQDLTLLKVAYGDRLIVFNL